MITKRAAIFAMARGGATRLLANPFQGTVSVTLPWHGHPIGLDVFATDTSRVARCFDEATGRAIYLIGGRVAHASLTKDALLPWCGRIAGNGAASAGECAALREILGPFAVLIDDRPRGRISFISDPLGLMPWFAGKADGRLVAGTDVLDICDAGLSSGHVDYDSVASWLQYSFVCTGGSLVRDYRRVAAGAVSTFTPAGELEVETPYVTPRYAQAVVPQEQLVETVHDHVQRTFDLLLRDVDEVNLPLSGGYDSRLLCALASRRQRLRVHLTVVESSPHEVIPARKVAEALKMPLRVLPTGASNIDLYNDPLYFTPEGFPVPRNLTSAVARLHPGMPLASGFLGDVLMRYTRNPELRAFFEQDDAGLEDEVLARSAHERFRLTTNRLHLLRNFIGPRSAARATAALLPAIKRGRATGRPLANTNLRLRHGHYFAGIFLNHSSVSEALLPYYSWDLLDFRMTHTCSFPADTYEQLFRRYFPELAGIPHSTQVTPQGGSNGRHRKNDRPTRHLRRWANELLRSVPGKWNRTAITPRKIMRRLPAALVGEGQYSDEIGYLHRINAFEERATQANIKLDWSQL